MTTEQDAMLRYTKESCLFGYDTDFTWDDIARQLESPDWSPSGPWQTKWQDFIPDDLRAVWGALPIEALTMARIFAEEAESRSMPY